MRILLLVLCLLMVGCKDDRTPAEKQIKQQQDAIEYVRRVMPKDAEIVEELGNDWYLVEFKVQGEPVRYLYRWWGWNGHFHIVFEPLQKSSTQTEETVVK